MTSKKNDEVEEIFDMIKVLDKNKLIHMLNEDKLRKFLLASEEFRELFGQKGLIDEWENIPHMLISTLKEIHELSGKTIELLHAAKNKRKILKSIVDKDEFNKLDDELDRLEEEIQKRLHEQSSDMTGLEQYLHDVIKLLVRHNSLMNKIKEEFTVKKLS